MTTWLPKTNVQNSLCVRLVYIVKAKSAIGKQLLIEANKEGETIAKYDQVTALLLF